MLHWEESYSVGVKELDDQHKKLIHIINELDQVEDERDAKVRILNALVEYTKEHFATEELYFRQFGFEKTDEHIEEHLELIAEVEDLVYQFAVGESLDAVKLKGFLTTWLVDHIQGADQEYVVCFKENGLK